MSWPAVLVVVAAGAVGAGVGWPTRLLLARLRRGTVVGPGPVETLLGVITAAGAACALGAPTVLLVVWAGWLTVTLGIVDLRHHRLPDAITRPAVAVSAGLIILTSLLWPGSGSLLRAFVVAGVIGVLFGLLARVSRGGLGRGDAKLVPSLALLTGYLSVGAAVTALALAFVLGAVVALVGMAIGRLDRRSAVPFGPALLLGCWLVLAVPGLAAAVS
ncbi:prepilin peptidase [Nakamurella flava]|uniref:Prepilin peptidase n=1 Tax=Nakamurella flava TaxID=2576308 RepID=A0A4U6QJN1_9ACTN|nr:A24 family peptidase [Nakamurella flava]TKV60419.1 prepilin peptidase [Nakamurella flava]